jgi:hypothetical protein
MLKNQGNADGLVSQNQGMPTTRYQAHDPNWDDPSISPVFDTRAEAEKYCKDSNMGNYHSYEVREVDYRYEVRVGFSDYTYSNGTWENTLYTAGDFNDAYEYVVEYSSAHSDLIIYDLKTGKSFEETP